MRPILTILLIVLNNLNVQAEVETNIILKNTHQKLQQLESISYQVSHFSKLYWQKDTAILYKQPVDIYRKPYKKYGKGVLIFERFEMLAYGNGSYPIINNPQCLHDLNTIESNFPSYFHLTGTKNLPKYGVENLAHIYFVNPDLLLLLESSPSTVNSIVEKQKKYWQLIFKIKEDKKKRDRSIELWINQETQHIEKMISRYQFKNFDGVQYDEWLFDNIKENNITPSIIDNKKMLFDEKGMMRMYLSKRKSNNNEATKLLPVGSIAPTFEGWNVLENREVHSSEFLGQPTILCFWKKNMFQEVPTFKFFSELNRLYADLGIQTIGLIAGQGNESYHIQDIQTYMEKRQLDFPTLLIDDSINSTFNVIGFPEIYILDKDGIIIKTYIGLLEHYKIEIKNIINKLSNE